MDRLLDTIEFLAAAPDSVEPTAQRVGPPGSNTYYYWVVAHFPIGITVTIDPAFISNAPTMHNFPTSYVVVNWENIQGATSYDVIRTRIPVFPKKPGNYGIVFGVSGGPIDDYQDPLPFDPASLIGLPWGAPVARLIHLNNRDYPEPTLELPDEVSVTTILFADGTRQSTAGGGGGGGSQSPWLSDVDAAGHNLINLGEIYGVPHQTLFITGGSQIDLGTSDTGTALVITDKITANDPIQANAGINVTSPGGYLLNGVPLVTGVSSVFGRTGDVVAQTGDYSAAQVTNAVSTLGSYANPSWITSLDYSKITNTPAPPVIPVTSVFGRTGAVVAQAGDYNASQVTNAVSTLGSYANPPWITSLDYSKITNVPAPPAAPVTSVFGRTGAITAQTGDYTVAQVTNAVSTQGSYADPSWITSLGWNKLTNVPALVNSFNGRSGAVVPASGDYTAAQVTNAVSTQGSYANPSWITSLDASKITNGASLSPVSSVFGRTGAITAATGDYTAAQVTNAVDTTQTYTNPSWIGSLGWGKLTSVPALVNSFNGRSGTVVPTTGDYTAAQVTNAVSTLGSYANPPWITSLDASKITNATALQTPWLSNIDAASHMLSNVSAVGIGVGAYAPYPLYINTTLSGTALIYVKNNASAYPALIYAANDTNVTLSFGVRGSTESSVASLPVISSSADLAFWTGATPAERMRITVAGHVGIGTSTPTYALDIVGDCNITGTYRVNGVPLSTGGGTPAGATGQVQFNNAGAFGASPNLFWDNTNMLLGVGTSTPQATFDVSGVIRSTTALPTPTGGVGVEMQYNIGATAGIIQAYDRTAGAYKELYVQGNPVAMTAGSVGIGTNTPASNLHVAKTGGSCTVNIGDDSNTTGSGICGIKFYAWNDGNIYADYKTQNVTYFRTGGTGSPGSAHTYMTVVGSNGYVGLFITPSHSLDINKVADGGYHIAMDVAGGIKYGIYCASSGYMQFDNAAAGVGAVMFFDGQNSNIGIRCTNPGYYLDIAGTAAGNMRLRTGGTMAGIWYDSPWGGSEFWCGTDPNQRIWRIYTGGAQNAFEVHYGGSVGIGIPGHDPTDQLTIGGLGASGYGQLRMIYGNYGAFFRNDGATFYLMFTNSGDPYGTWRAPFPWQIDIASCNVAVNSQLTVQGGLISNAQFTSSAHALIWSNSVDSSFTQGAVEIRQTNQAGGVAGDNRYAPRIGFHWTGVVASQLGMDASGNIRTFDNPGTGFAPFIASWLQGPPANHNDGCIYCTTISGSSNPAPPPQTVCFEFQPSNKSFFIFVTDSSGVLHIGSVTNFS